MVAGNEQVTSEWRGIRVSFVGARSWKSRVGQVIGIAHDTEDQVDGCVPSPGRAWLPKATTCPGWLSLVTSVNSRSACICREAHARQHGRIEGIELERHDGLTYAQRHNLHRDGLLAADPGSHGLRGTSPEHPAPSAANASSSDLISPCRSEYRAAVLDSPPIWSISTKAHAPWLGTTPALTPRQCMCPDRRPTIRTSMGMRHVIVTSTLLPATPHMRRTRAIWPQLG